MLGYLSVIECGPDCEGVISKSSLFNIFVEIVPGIKYANAMPVVKILINVFQVNRVIKMYRV
jgi:uncharacterized membrane protein YfbV (UPF0208 family)